jgi:hypothetical protein
MKRELDSRTNNGIEVRLLWRPADDRALVAVTDTKTGEAIELMVRKGDSALDAFHHPYAYAAWRGVGAGSGLAERVPGGASRSS